MHRPRRVARNTSSPSRQVATPISRSPSSSFIAIRPEARTLRKSDRRLRRTLPDAVANTRCRLIHRLSSCGSGSTVVIVSAPSSGQQVDERAALGGRPGLGQTPDLLAERLAARAEEQHPLMRVRVEAARHDVVAARRRAGAAAAAAVLRPERLQRRALDEAVARDGHDHLPRLDQALVVLVGRGVHDRGHARRRKLGARRRQLAAHHLHAPHIRAEDVEQIRDAAADLGQLGLDLVPLKPGQPLQAQFEDAARLLLRQPDRLAPG